MKFSLAEIRRDLRPSYAPANAQFKCLNEFHDKAVWVIKIFYIASLSYSYGLINTLFHKDPFAAYFLWPVSWLEIGNLKAHMVFIPVVLFLVNCVLVVNHDNRLLRIIFAALCLFTAAIESSYGAINHGWHEWFWISFLLIFLPNREGMNERAYKLYSLSIIVYLQALLLLFYSMAGMAKLKAGITSLGSTNGGNFSVDGFASLIADRMIQGEGTTILGWVFVDYPFLGMPMFTALILIQSASFVIAFMPRWHIIWGMMLIMFHLGTALAMDIYFGSHILWLAIFVIASPFAPRWNSWPWKPLTLEHGRV